ncbi:MAG: PDDEXK nuclease domain-containing protein [Fibromonadaceae bacterium]|jgi:predicted nuclease of restriction endonuclease-like (RecB) superfamily|nr:PDDEXK nuclease domain-containing protein [Fibromonadaceae bacterium]
MTEVVKLSEYRNWLRDLKQQIKTGQIKAALSVNSQMIMLYWDLGRQIVEKQEKTKWGSGFIEQLSKDLKKEFPEMAGFSKDNLIHMRKFYRFYSSFAEQVVPQIAKQPVLQMTLVPWGHHVLLLKKVKDIKQALFYINKIIENSWSRAVLEYQIETNLYARQGKAITNFNHTLPEPQSDLANEIMKDPYNFDFLCLSEKAKETDIEKALVQHISQFLPELGIGFAYMGRQFLLKIGDSDYRIELLFYHTRLKCYMIIELKTKEFEPEFVGKLNFYITAINELVKDIHDNPTIRM